MRPGNNPIETYKTSKGGDGLRVREDLPRLIQQGTDALTLADKELLKWVGVFFRRPTPGKFMMRIRMPNGFTTSDQLVAIADLSSRIGNGTLDITTRQQIELRGYTLESVPEIWEKLRGVNLRSLQTGMDNIRNLNGCPLSGLTPHELLDTSPIVLELDRRIVGDDGNPEFTNLPRKMNVTVTGCLENCTHNESQDIALVPATKTFEGVTRLGFHVLIGGKMGSGGFTIASNIGWFITPPRAVEVVLEIIRLYRDEGSRDARNKNRFAFLIEAWGLNRIRTTLEERMGWTPPSAGQEARIERHTDHLGVAAQQQPGLCTVGLGVTVGRIQHESLRELARLASAYGSGAVRLTTGQNAVLINIPQERVDALLREPLLREMPPEPSRFVRGLVSCTGTQYCNLAVIETKARAVAIAQALEQRAGSGPPLTVYWSGCPAACGNHLAADIGLRGMKVNVGGKSVDAVAIYVGGRTGPQAKSGQPIMEMVPCDDALPDVLATIVKHLELFKQVEPIQVGAKDRVLMVPAGGDDPSPSPMASASHKAPSPARPAITGTPLEATTMKVCNVEELAIGTGRLVTFGEKSLAVFRHETGVVAVDAECPHEGGPLQDGSLEDGCVVCPVHNYRFDAASGRCDVDPDLRVKTYPASVKDGAVWVEVSP